MIESTVEYQLPYGPCLTLCTYSTLPITYATYTRHSCLLVLTHLLHTRLTIKYVLRS